MWANTDYYTPTNMRHNVPCQDSRGFVNLRGGVVLPVPCEAATVVCNQLCCLLYLYNIYIYIYIFVLVVVRISASSSTAAGKRLVGDTLERRS